MGRLELWRRRSPERRALIALGISVSAAAGPAALAAPASAHLQPGCSRSGSEVTCTYTSGANEVKIPGWVTSVDVTAAGGMGASGLPAPVIGGGTVGAPGGYGATVTGDLPIAGPEVLWAVVGSNGAPANNNSGVTAGGGGGESDVRTSENDLATRLLVAAGGGGGGLAGYSDPFVGGAGGNAGEPGEAGATMPPAWGITNGLGGEPGSASTGGAGGAGGISSGTANACPGLDGALGMGGTGGNSTTTYGASANCTIPDGAGGGGGGGLYGGGGGGGGGWAVGLGFNGTGHGVQGWAASGGGGGGSNLVPASGSATVDTKGAPYVQISYNRHH